MSSIKIPAKAVENAKKQGKDIKIPGLNKTVIIHHDKIDDALTRFDDHYIYTTKDL